MLNRYWQWTSQSGNATAGVPFGPLRYRAWTSGTVSAPAASSLPFGPVRYRSWTSGVATTPYPPLQDAIGTPIRIDLSRRRLLLRDDEEIAAFLIALVASGALNPKDD